MFLKGRPPCISRLSPQYGRQSKLSCLTETTRKLPVSLQLPKVKTMLKLPWPLLEVNLRILSGFIWTRKNIFCKKKIRRLLFYLALIDELRTSCHDGWRWLIFGAKLETDTVLGTINPFSQRFKSASMIGPGRGGTSHVTDFDETRPVWRSPPKTTSAKVKEIWSKPGEVDPEPQFFFFTWWPKIT